MSGIFSGALATGLLAAMAMVVSGIDNGPAPAMAKALPDAGQAFRLQVGGVSSCRVQRGTVDMRGHADLELDGCETLHPGLGEVRFWNEGADGTVTFTQEDGGVVIEFAVADGVAYQSFQPGAPLASLVALN